MYVDNAQRVRVRVFLCTVACRVEWRLRRRLAPMLFAPAAYKWSPPWRTSVSSAWRSTG